MHLYFSLNFKMAVLVVPKNAKCDMQKEISIFYDQGFKMLRCLVVDDDELSRELLATQLLEYAACDMAANGNEGVEKFAAALASDNPYHVVFMDILMPGLDGHGAAKEIRKIEERQGIPVERGIDIIILSSLGTPHDVIQAYIAAQSAAHLVKPVKPEKLYKTLLALNLIESSTPD